MRFRRGLRAGFLVAAGLAVGTLVLVEVATSSLNHDVGYGHELATQRAEVARLSERLALLAGVDDAAEGNRLRIEMGSAVVDVARRQTELQRTDPALAASTVEWEGTVVEFDRAFASALALLDESVELLADPDASALVGSQSVVATISALAALDPVYEARTDTRADAVFETTATLRQQGRWVAGLALAAAILRLVVLGRPLVRQLEIDNEEYRRTTEEGVEIQMRSIVSSRLAEGMEAVDDEQGVRVVVERTLARLMPTRPAEMLLADSSKAHLAVQAGNPLLPTPGCDVQSPWSCPAVRRGRTQVFDDSDGLRACPHLSGRPEGACSAVCVPVAFVDDSMGVLHVTGEVGWTPNDFEVFALEALAGQAAVRLGTIRSFEKAEIQAGTDVLTGLPNRRAVEDHLARFLGTRTSGAVAIADLDHFKALNDTYGHEVGDRSLRVFAEVLRGAVREQDIAGRWGGEEFVLVLPGMSARESVSILDRIRTDLAVACARGDGPLFTVSIGVVDTNAGTGLGTLIGLADQCLYAAKEAGRDRVIVGPVGTVAADGATFEALA